LRLPRAGVVWTLVRREFAERFAGSILGAGWAVIWPLVSLGIYIVIFGNFMGARLPGQSSYYAYSVYLCIGLIPWTCFAGTISRSCTVFLDKKTIIARIPISLPSLLIYVNLTEVITCLVSMAFLFLFLVLSGYDITVRYLLLPFIVYLQQILAFSLGLVSATLSVFLRDLKEIVGIILQIWFWFTPIIYVADILPPAVREILKFNPAFIITESYQRIVIFGDYPALASLALLTLITHLLLVVAYGLFRRLEKDVRDFL